MTNRGESYTGGYCTTPCTPGAPGCPSGSSCVDLSLFGEPALCLKNCAAAPTSCGTGYACYSIMPTQVCWLSPLPPPDAGAP